MNSSNRKSKYTYFLLWLLALISLFLPLAFTPTPWNGSGTYITILGNFTPWSGIGFVNPFTVAFYVLGLVLGLVVLLRYWDSQGLTILSGSLMILTLIALLVVVNLFSQLDCNPCYPPVLDVGFFIVFAIQLLYTIGGAKLQ